MPLHQWGLDFLGVLEQKGKLSPADRRKFLSMELPHTFRIGELACFHDYLTSVQVHEILEEQVKTKRPFGRVAISKGHIAKEKLIALLEELRRDELRTCVSILSGMTDQPRESLETEMKTYIESMGTRGLDEAV